MQRAVLPRVLSLAQVEHVIANTPVEIEVFGFGSLCVMVEGRCALSSYATGDSPNTTGVCSPAKAVRWQDTATGPGVAPERRADRPLCRRARTPATRRCARAASKSAATTYYAIEEPSSLNTLELLPQLMEIGVAAIKIEGRQRSPAYVAQVTRVWRAGDRPLLRRSRALSPCARMGPGLAPRRRRPAAHPGRLSPPVEMTP